MGLSGEEEQAIDNALRHWRQGDVTLDAGLEFCHLADLSRPHSAASIQLAEQRAELGGPVEPGAVPLFDDAAGLVVVTQTCDVIRPCTKRPFVEVSPLVKVDDAVLEETRRFRRPALAYVPATAGQRLVADLDRTMTVEKALVAGCTRLRGCPTEIHRRDFASALSRKRCRFAFPDDFQQATSRFQEHFISKNFKSTDEGAHIRALSEIRVRAAPSWEAQEVHLTFWFIKEEDPPSAGVAWPACVERWLKLIDNKGRFRLEPATVVRLDDITARDYCESDRLDLDRSSIPRKA